VTIYDRIAQLAKDIMRESQSVPLGDRLFLEEVAIRLAAIAVVHAEDDDELLLESLDYALTIPDKAMRNRIRDALRQATNDGK
jgi:hypothetical protein